MRNRTKIFLGIGAATMLALGGLAGLAQADMDGGMHGGGQCGMGHGGGHGPGMMGRQMMERYDANKDGKLTQAEIDQNRQQWLADADANKDGTLSLDEFKVLWLKARNEMMVREFQFFDRDGNGQVTIENTRARWPTWWPTATRMPTARSAPRTVRNAANGRAGATCTARWAMAWAREWAME